MDYAQMRAVEVLSSFHLVVLATSGSAGTRASRLECEAIGLNLYLLVPSTSDHLFNLETNPVVALVADCWEMLGLAYLIQLVHQPAGLGLLEHPDARWHTLVEVRVSRLHSRSGPAWSASETIDVEK